MVLQNGSHILLVLQMHSLMTIHNGQTPMEMDLEITGKTLHGMKHIKHGVLDNGCLMHPLQILALSLQVHLLQIDMVVLILMAIVSLTET